MAKGLSLKEFKKNNLFITILMVIVVIGLLFVPDFFGFDNSTSINKTSKVDLDFKSIWSGITDPTFPTAKKETAEAASHVEVLVDKDKKLKGDKPQKKALIKEEPPLQTEVSWETMNGQVNRRLLSKTKALANELASELPLDMRASRFALFDYVAGIDFILDTASSKMSAYEAVQYMERLDLAVSQSLKSENADRAYFVKWSKLSLTSVLGSNYTTSIKESLIPKFNPRIIIKQIVAERIPKAYKKNGKPSAYDYYLTMTGYFQGKDIISVQALHNGDFVGGLFYKTIKSGRGAWFEFEAPRVKSGLLSLVFESNDGQKSVAHYNFSTRGGRFPWKNVVQRENRGTLKARSLEMGKALEARYRFDSQTDNVDFGNLLNLTANNNSHTQGNLLNQSSGKKPYVNF